MVPYMRAPGQFVPGLFFYPLEIPQKNYVTI